MTSGCSSEYRAKPQPLTILAQLLGRILSVCLVSLLLILGPRPVAAATTFLHPWLDFPTNWKTSVVVVNLGPTATAVRLLAYNSAGSFLGEVPGGMALAPGERGSYATTSTLPGGTAVLSVQADTPLASVILLEATDGSAREVLLPANPPAPDFTLPVLSGSTPWTSQLRLVNAGTAVTVPTVVARDAAGQVLGRLPLPALASLASTTVDLRSLFAQTLLATAATLQVTADQPLTALQLLGATDRPDVAALPAPLAAGTSLLLPIVTQGPTGPLWTLAGIQNPQDAPVAVTVEALDAQGRSLGVLPELTTLPARGSHLFRTPDLGGTLPAGTAALRLTATQPLSGYSLVGGTPTAGITALVALGPADSPAGYDLVAPPDGPVLTAAPWWLGAAGQSLTALGDPGAGAGSQRLSAPAAAPATGKLTLTWADTANDFTGFKIERRTGTSGAYALLTTVGPVFTYTDIGLPVGTTYCYQVKAANAAGDSPPSNEACASVTTTSGANSPSPSPASPSAGDGGGGGGGGCFIATAAYGSPLAAEVQVLREFRDRQLLTHGLGRFLVATYYRLSPPLARVIASHDALRALTRGALQPLIWWTRLALASPTLALVLGGGGLLAGPLLPLLLRRPWRTRAARSAWRTKP